MGVALDTSWALAKNVNNSVCVCCEVQIQILAELSSSASLVSFFCKTVPNHICSTNSNPAAVFFTWCHTCSYFLPFWTLTLLQCFLPGATLAHVSSPVEPVSLVVAVGCLDWVRWQRNKLNKNWLLKWGRLLLSMDMTSDNSWFEAKNVNISVCVCCDVQIQILAEPSNPAAALLIFF